MLQEDCKLRKERGYNPTDVLGVASILDLDEESLEMIKEKAEDLAFLGKSKTSKLYRIVKSTKMTI